MKFATASSPHTPSTGELNALMRQVIYALLPAIATAWWFFGWGVLINIAVASIFALGAEAAILLLRNRPLAPALSDCSALLTAILLGLALPALAPWWLAAVGALFAIVFAKQLYGGLGFNPFNPAMVGYVVLLISFPLEMTSWPAPQELATVSLSLVETLSYSFGGTLPAALGLDALTTATPLDTIKTGVGLEQSVAAISQSPLFGEFGGKGWEWLAAAYLLGGLWLLYKRIISWHIPAGLLGALALIATLFWLGDASRYASPLFHLFSGAAIIGAFFIATDPISAATTLRGRLLFGIGIGLITYIIRTWGGYPDGIAFAVLLMNMAAPTLDYYTRPRVFGQGGR